VDAYLPSTGARREAFPALGGTGAGAMAWLKVPNGQMGLVRQRPGRNGPRFVVSKIISGDHWRKMSHWWATILQRSW
jgi:hypothetical protein